MQVIVEALQDPTDFVLQGAVIGDVPMGDVPNSRLPWFVLQGEIKTAAINEQPVPGAMIGQHDWYGIRPRTVGPMRVGGGEIVMQDIGQKPIDVFVDAIQRWLSSVFQVDQSGFMMSIYDAKTIGAPEAFAEFMVPEPETLGNPVVTIPRRAIYRSGLIKQTTVPQLPDSFGRHTIMDSFVETTRKWFISGVTKNSVGAALGNCRVLVMQTDKIIVNPDTLANPIVADITSDGSGNFSLQTNTVLPFQMMAYLDGSPDVAGLTINEIIPVEV